MGIAQAGLAFRPTSSIANLQSFIANLCGEDAAQIAHPNSKEFDIRRHTDVMVQFFGENCFICNNDLVWDILEHPRKDVGRTYRALGSLDMILAFCLYESGGSYGYAFIEQGKRTRSRLQTFGVPTLPPLLEHGIPKAFEQRWLSADFYLDEDDDCPADERQKIYYQGGNRDTAVPEHALTRRLLDESLQMNFGVCPWATDVAPIYHFFKLSAKKKPWWRFTR